MGACNFDQIGFGRTFSEAFYQGQRSARQDAEADGLGTNGTICDITMNGLRYMPLEGNMTEKAVDDWLDKAWNETQKYEARWVELTGARAKVYTRSPGRRRGDKVFLFAGWAHE